MYQNKPDIIICATRKVDGIMASDMSYDVSCFKLQDTVKKNDLILAIYGSGNSKNIINAVSYAKGQGTKIIGLTGYLEGKLKNIADYSMHISADDMQIAEDLYMMMRLFCERKNY